MPIVVDADVVDAAVVVGPTVVLHTVELAKKKRPKVVVEERQRHVWQRQLSQTKVMLLAYWISA